QPPTRAVGAPPTSPPVPVAPPPPAYGGATMIGRPVLAPGQAPPAPRLQPEAPARVEQAGIPGAVFPAPKSNLIPIALGVVGVVLVAGAVLGYWGWSRAKNAALQPVPVATQSSSAASVPAPGPGPASAPAPGSAPVVLPTTPHPTAAGQPAPVAGTAPPVVKKPVVRKPTGEAAEPAPAPAA